MKSCTKCGIEKEVSEFYKHPETKDGLLPSCKACKIAYTLSTMTKNSEKRREYHKKYIAGYQRKRRSEDPMYKLASTLRSRLYDALKGKNKSGSAVRDLGCSIEQLKSHLESKFEHGMSWENHGKWHIDHIKPISSFDLRIREQLLEACHFTNLQPLWAFDNFSKGKR